MAYYDIDKLRDVFIYTIIDDQRFDLPSDSVLYGNKSYNCYQQEGQLEQHAQLQFQPIRKSNSKKEENSDAILKLISISQLINQMPRLIHAVTQNGFLIQIIGFIVAQNLLFLF